MKTLPPIWISIRGGKFSEKTKRQCVSWPEDFYTLSIDSSVRYQ